MQIIHEKRRISYAVSKMFEEDYCFSCSRNDRFPLANYKNSCVTLWSSTWNACTFDSYFLHCSFLVLSAGTFVEIVLEMTIIKLWNI